MRKNAKVWLVFLLVPVLVLAVSSRAKRDSGGNSEDLRPVLEAYELIRERYYAPDSLDEKEILKAAIEGMLDELPDDYNVVYDEEEYKEYQEELEGNYVGVGMEITARNDAIEVVARFPDTPAAQGGIEPGDLILSVDGKSTEDMSVGDVSDAIKGEAGTEVDLLIGDPGGGDREITLTRKEITIPAVELEFTNEGKIAVLDVNLFSQVTPKELASRLKELQGGREVMGYILDLRNNSGGLLNSALSVASQFVDEGLITELESPDGNKEYETSGNSITNLPLVVLINEGTASASELVAAAIRGNGMGVLAGRNSFGKGLVQTTHNVGDGLKVKISSARYLTPEGKRIPEEGLEPNLETSDAEEDLKVAINWIKERRGELTPLNNSGEQATEQGE